MKVAEADGKEFRYTQAEIFFDNYRDAEFIAQQLSIIAVRSGGKYKAEYNTVKQQYNNLMHKLFMYGGFVIAVFSIILFKNSKCFFEFRIVKSARNGKLHQTTHTVSNKCTHFPDRALRHLHLSTAHN